MIHILDVRSHLAEGMDPFDAIKAAWAELPIGDALEIQAPFMPLPLIAVFSAQGIAVRPSPQGDGSAKVLFGPKAC